MSAELSTTSSYSCTNLDFQTVIDKHKQILHNFNIKIESKQEKLPSLYWIPKLHKTPYKSRFIANASSSTTTHISKLLTYCLTAVRNHVVKYCEKVYENSGINIFWSIKNSTEVLDKFSTLNFHCSAVNTYDFSTLYTSLPHDLIKTKLIALIEKTFAREQRLYIACHDSTAFFTNTFLEKFTMWTCTDVCEALCFLLDNIYIKCGDTLFRQVIGIPMGTNCAPLIADLFLYCFERDFMLTLSPSNQSHIIEAFNLTSRYLDDILTIDNPFFPQMIHLIYPPELTLNKANN